MVKMRLAGAAEQRFSVVIVGFHVLLYLPRLKLSQWGVI